LCFRFVLTTQKKHNLMLQPIHTRMDDSLFVEVDSLLVTVMDLASHSMRKILDASYYRIHVIVSGRSLEHGAPYYLSALREYIATHGVSDEKPLLKINISGYAAYNVRFEDRHIIADILLKLIHKVRHLLAFLRFEITEERLGEYAILLGPPVTYGLDITLHLEAFDVHVEYLILTIPEEIWKEEVCTKTASDNLEVLSLKKTLHKRKV